MRNSGAQDVEETSLEVETANSEERTSIEEIDDTTAES